MQVCLPCTANNPQLLRFIQLDPHLGHLYSLVVADVFARYQRLRNPGTSVNFVTGTDEHGMKIQKAAKEHEMGPLEFCTMKSAKFQVRGIRSGCEFIFFYSF